MADFDRLLTEAQTAFNKSNSISELDAAKSMFLGKSGAIGKLFKTFVRASPEEKRELGKSINIVKSKIEVLLSARKTALVDAETLQRLAGEGIDICSSGISSSKRTALVIPNKSVQNQSESNWSEPDRTGSEANRKRSEPESEPNRTIHELRGNQPPCCV